MRDKMRNSERGQVLLIVVLVMVVFLVIGLSVVSRSIFNVRTAVDEEKSQRAFSAAEAGVEQALQVLKSGGGLTSSNCGGNALICAKQLNTADTTTQILKTTVSQVSSDQLILNNGSQVLKDDGYDLWLSSYPDYSSPKDLDLTLYWGDIGNTDACSNAALEVVLIAGSKAAPSIRRLVYDPCSARQSANSFTLVSPGGGTVAPSGQPPKNFNFKQTLPHIVSGLIMRIVPLYFSAPVGVISSNSISLPVQGSQISSTGVSAGTARQITYFQGYPALPSEFFPYILFAK